MIDSFVNDLELMLHYLFDQLDQNLLFVVYDAHCCSGQVELAHCITSYKTTGCGLMVGN